MKTVSQRPDAYLIGKERTTDLNEWVEKREHDYSAMISARDAARAAIALKDETREEFMEKLRVAARLIQANDKVIDAARKDAGLPVHKATRMPVTVPTTFPVGFVMASDRLEHTIS